MVQRSTRKNKVNLQDKFAKFEEVWTPKIVAESNGQLVKLAKGKDKLVWHAHEEEDELFFVVQGQLVIHLRDDDVVLNPGEMFVVPKGVEHCPEATEETHFLMIEPASTKHTGSNQSDVTVSFDDQEWI